MFCAGVAMQTAATDVPLFTVGRVFAGLGVGGVSCLVPIVRPPLSAARALETKCAREALADLALLDSQYQSECAPKAWRGFIVSGYQWFITSTSYALRGLSRGPVGDSWAVRIDLKERSGGFRDRSLTCLAASLPAVGLLIAAVVVERTRDRPDASCYRIPVGIQVRPLPLPSLEPPLLARTLSTAPEHLLTVLCFIAARVGCHPRQWPVLPARVAALAARHRPRRKGSSVARAPLPPSRGLALRRRGVRQHRRQRAPRVDSRQGLVRPPPVQVGRAAAPSPSVDWLRPPGPPATLRNQLQYVHLLYACGAAANRSSATSGST